MARGAAISYDRLEDLVEGAAALLTRGRGWRCQSHRYRILPAGWRIVLLASLGGTLEFYDFVIFGVFARDMRAVFPSASPLGSLMASFAAFAAGYLARPLGGIILSHYGDRYGRRRVFLWSVFVMSGATLGMGLVPDYAQWGVAASALMVTCVWSRASASAASSPARSPTSSRPHRSIAPFVCGVVFACVTMGVAVATGVSLSVRTFLDPADACRSTAGASRSCSAGSAAC